ncbi:hypothetical protein ACHAXS_013705 [Conticribra weissflogii]
MTPTRRITRSSVRSATAQATFSAQSYTPRRLRSSNSNTSSRSRAMRASRTSPTTISSERADPDEMDRPRRQSTRRAAVQARDRINAAYLQQQAARRATRASQVEDPSSASNFSSPPRPGSLKSPIVLDDDNDEDEEEVDSKPAALPNGTKSNQSVASTSGDSLLEDFTCAICLDCPSTCEDVAKISGCTHKFCFDCIDRWAKTENRCPCCKARFRTIERVVPLSEVDETVAATPPGRGRKRKARRGKRDRFRSAAANGAASDTAASARVNSRRVEDRNQPVAGIAMSQEMVRHIIEAVRQYNPDRNISDGGDLQIRFVGGRPQPILRIPSPSGADGGGLGNGIEFLEFVMNFSGGEGGMRTFSLTQVRGRGANSAAGRRESATSGLAASGGVANATGADASIAPFNIGTNGEAIRSDRRQRPITWSRGTGPPINPRERNRQPRFIFGAERNDNAHNSNTDGNRRASPTNLRGRNRQPGFVFGDGSRWAPRGGVRSSPRTRSGRSPDHPVVLDE